MNKLEVEKDVVVKSAEEIYKILQNDLGDFDTFLAGVKNILE